MKYYMHFLISSICIILSFLFFAFQREWIIIQFPQKITKKDTNSIIMPKKRAVIYFWKQSTWQSETRDILWSNDTATNLYYLITNWLCVLEEEDILEKKVTLQTALIAPSAYNAYLSFDRTFLPKELSVFAKLCHVQSLLKTVQHTMQLETIQFLIHHQPMQDPHIDFSNPWPVTGFI